MTGANMISVDILKVTVEIKVLNQVCYDRDISPLCTNHGNFTNFKSSVIVIFSFHMERTVAIQTYTINTASIRDVLECIQNRR